jgi:hypothetical protein
MPVTKSRIRLYSLLFCMSGLALLLQPPTDAKAASANFHYSKDLSNLHGFDYSPASAVHGMWQDYNHNEIDRDFGYAERLHLNAVRSFVSYRDWQKDKDAFRAHLIDYVRLANAHGIGVMLTLPAGVVGGPPSHDVNLSPEFKAQLRAFAQFLVDAVGKGKEPGLAFWDVANEPDFVKPPLVIMTETTDGKIARQASHAHASPPGSDQPHNMAVARYMGSVFNEIDPRTPITVGCMMPTACLQESASYVDFLSFHDYSQTVEQMDAVIALAKKVAAASSKSVIDTEMGCVARADPVALEIEEHEKAHVGWMTTQIMFTHAWAPVHGVFYPDGSIRNPDIVAAILGFFRYRGPHPVLEEPDREGIASGVLDDARKWLRDSNPDWTKGLVIAETEANLLEAGQLVGMRVLPTRQVYALKAGQPNLPALHLLIDKFTADLAPYAIPGTIPLHRYYTPVVAH